MAKRLRAEARTIAANSPTTGKLRIFKKWTGKIDLEGKKVITQTSSLFYTGYRKVYKDSKRRYKDGTVRKQNT